MDASALWARAPLALPQGANQRWSLDFVADSFNDGRRFRIFAVVDDFTRECLALVADTSLSGARVVRELDTLTARRGMLLLVVVSDNGTELTGMAILRLSHVREHSGLGGATPANVAAAATQAGPGHAPARLAITARFGHHNSQRLCQ